MNKTFVVMPSWPENQVNIQPGYGEFSLSSGTKVEYYYNVVNSTFEVNLPGDVGVGFSASPTLDLRDLQELVEFLTVVRDHMIEVNGE